MKIFLSFSFNHGQELTRAVERLLALLKMEDVPPSWPWDQAIAHMIKQADLMVMLISKGVTSWGMREIDAAIKHSLPILPIVIGSSNQLPEQLRDVETIPLKGVSDPQAVAASVAQQIRQSIGH